jgi:DnaJ-class molecular chaperone
MADDLYSVLDVAKTATADEISKAYRKLAKKLHPDLNPGDAAAEAKFKEVSAAYSILNDPEKRGRYDRGEIDASGQERPQQRYYREYAGGDEGARYYSSAGFEDLGDIFGDLFGRRGQAGGFGGAGAGGYSGGGFGGAGARGFAMRGQDANYRLEVDFLEAARGAKKRITLPDGGTLDVGLPAGVRDGQVLRLKGKGQPGSGGAEAGDALVEITVRPHPVFKRDGLDIQVELPVGFDEAVLGGKVEVPTIDGTVSMNIPAGANSGQTLRLKGRGIKSKAKTGDQLVKLQVMLPDAIDSDLKAFAEEWRDKHGYDPRRKMREQA